MVFFRLCCALLLTVVGAAGAWSAQPSRSRQGQPPAQAPQGERPQGDMRIAAVVNDDVISLYDLALRMRMVMISSNIGDTPEIRQRIAGQVLRGLIDEKLQLQEAKRQNVAATEEEVNNAIQQIEKQNNMKSGGLDEFLKVRGLDRSALVNQLTASIVWAKLVRRQASQSTEITEEEVDETLKRLKERASEPQARVGEIFLAVDNPSQEEEVRRLAERLAQQMRSGARFSAVAQQFSQSATSSVGGDIGWVRPDQLAPELGKAVTQLKVGELSAPIRAGSGFYLVLVIDRRNGPAGSGPQETIYDLVQVVFPLGAQASDATKRAAIAEAQSVRTAAKDCPGMLRIGKEKAPQFSSEGKVRATQMSAELRNLISKTAVGEVTAPIMQRNGVGVIMVCAKADGTSAAAPITRDEAGESLLKQRLDTLARRYLRDLRRNAYVDVRV